MALVLAGELYCDLLAQDSRSSAQEPLRDAWLQLTDGKITAIGAGEMPADEIIADYRGYTVTPAFCDMHTHGGGGHAFDELATATNPRQLAAQIAAAHAQDGTQNLVLSLVTADLKTLCARAAAAAAICESDPRYAGIHLEGPFLAPSRRGAHDPQQLINPTPAAVTALLNACGGYLRQITIAPELPGAFAAIKQLVAAGVRVAVGHSECDYDTAQQAFQAGANILTHAFNAMPGLAHRAPGPVAAALDDPSVTLEVIADGEHVNPRMVRLLFENAPGRVALISDAMAAAGMPDGAYLLGNLPVRVVDGLPRLVDEAGNLGSIAGSTLRLLTAVNNAISWGVPQHEALAAVTTVPATALGMPQLAQLRPGAPATFTVLKKTAAASPLAGAPLAARASGAPSAVATAAMQPLARLATPTFTLHRLWPVLSAAATESETR